MRTRTRICLLALISLEAAFRQQTGNTASVSAASKVLSHDVAVAPDMLAPFKKKH
jgi:hypothetical protein